MAAKVAPAQELTVTDIADQPVAPMPVAIAMPMPVAQAIYMPQPAQPTPPVEPTQQPPVQPTPPVEPTPPPPDTGPPVLGVSLDWLLNTDPKRGFAGACAAAGVAWTEPRSDAEWRERLESSARLSISADPNQAAAGHVIRPELFSDKGGYTTPFELVKVKVISELPAKKINRLTKVSVAPCDASGTLRPELAIETTCGECVLRKTRELVYNFIGQGRVQGVTNAKAETFWDYAQREQTLPSGAGGPATDFVSHSWGDYFCDMIDALVPPNHELFHAYHERHLGPFACCVARAIGTEGRRDLFYKPSAMTPKALVDKRKDKYFWIGTCAASSSPSNHLPPFPSFRVLPSPHAHCSLTLASF